MTQPSRVLLTGNEGFIGSVMGPLFKEAGYDVVGLDTGYYRDCNLIEPDRSIPTISKDIRDLTVDDVRGFDAVVHLAALSNDPIGNLDAGWTADINDRGSVRLAELSREAGVRRFLFSSSCIMYGMSVAGVATEESPLDPQTEYARSKVRSERAITELASDSFSPTFLRNGTVYGLSPRMRFDTVFNSLLGAALTSGKVSVFSDGKPWRPVIHVEDVSRAFRAVLEAPLADVHNQAFNTGAERLNYQIIDLARIAVQTVPGAVLEVLSQPDADQRTYKTDFSKFARTFPSFEFRWDPEAGAVQVYDAFKAIGLTADNFTSPRFTRLKWIRHLIDSGRVDADLRWSEQPEAVAR
jgi:nucleoside-diphosphate-sugar epimerase